MSVSSPTWHPRWRYVAALIATFGTAALLNDHLFFVAWCLACLSAATLAGFSLRLLSNARSTHRLIVSSLFLFAVRWLLLGIAGEFASYRSDVDYHAHTTEFAPITMFAFDVVRLFQRFVFDVFPPSTFPSYTRMVLGMIASEFIWCSALAIILVIDRREGRR